MKTIKRPDNQYQPQLFDDEEYNWWATKLSPNALSALENGWEGVFRRSILKLMPAEQLGTHFSEKIGRPTKELYAMAGLMLIAEFRDLTGEQTAAAYTFDASVQFALNLPRDHQYLSPRSVDNYRKAFREDELAQSVFIEVSKALVSELNIDIKQQRLDSTHVLSNMAKLTRRRLLSVGVKRFLVQVKKHHPDNYENLDEALLERYSPAESRLFGGYHPVSKKKGSKDEEYEQLGQDMAALILEFSEHESINAFKSYGHLNRLFEEHFEVPVKPKTKPKLRPRSKDDQGGSTRTLQNPSDEDAGYDGHKGAGYQAQIAQSYPPLDENGEPEGPGIITGLLAESAADQDSAAVALILTQQETSDLKPDALSADTAYGSDANVCACAEECIELISPVNGAPIRKKAPKHGCSRAEKERKKRLAARRKEEETQEWKDKYAKRSGIEGINRALDQVTGFKQLRVRGKKAVGMALNLKAAGWNIATAAKIYARRKRKEAGNLVLDTEQLKKRAAIIINALKKPFSPTDFDPTAATIFLALR
jgi:hypothetical protein